MSNISIWVTLDKITVFQHFFSFNFRIGDTWVCFQRVLSKRSGVWTIYNIHEAFPPVLGIMQACRIPQSIPITINDVITINYITPQHAYFSVTIGGKYAMRNILISQFFDYNNKFSAHKLPTKCSIKLQKKLWSKPETKFHVHVKIRERRYFGTMTNHKLAVNSGQSRATYMASGIQWHSILTVCQEQRPY